MHRSFFFAATSALLFATPALAQEADPQSADFDRETVTLGVAGVYMPDYEGSNDYRFTAAPAGIGTIKGFNFVLAGNRISVDLIPDQTGSGPGWDFQAGPIGVLNFNRTSTKAIDDSRIKALGKLDTGIELGGYVGIGKTGIVTSPYDKLSLSLSYRHDVNKVTSSDIWQPTINYFTPLSTKAAVGLFGSAEHTGRGYATTYFGITPAQSIASGLPVYNPRGGWKNWTVGGVATYSLTGDLLHGIKVVGGVTYRRMLNDFADSPVVSVAGSRDQWLGALGLAYTF